MACGLVVQREMGLRPGEAIAIVPSDVSLPEHLSQGSTGCRAIIALGTRKSTKAKRIQSVVVRNPVVIGLLRWMISVATPGGTLMGCSYDSYRKYLRSCQAQARLECGYSPHSPRAGFATESVAEGYDFVAIREGGRWLSDSSLRIYLDLIGAAQLSAQAKLEGRESELAWAARHFVSFLPGAEACFRVSDFENGTFEDPFIQGPLVGARRPPISRLESRARPASSGLPCETLAEDTHGDSPSDSDSDGGPHVAFQAQSGGSAGGAEGDEQHASRSRGRGAQGSKGRGRRRAQASTSARR